MKEQPFSIDYWYQILELGMDATAQEAKSAHRRLARKFHPDLNPGNKNAEEKFKEVQQAYELVLRNIQQLSTDFDSHPKSSNQNPVEGVRVRVCVNKSNQSAEFDEAHPPSATQERNSETFSSPSFFEAQQLKLNLLQKLQNLLSDSQWNQVIQEIEKLGMSLKNNPDICFIKAEAYYGLTQEYALSNNYEQACICIQKAVRADPCRHKYWQEIEQQYHRIAQQHFLQTETKQEETFQAEFQYASQENLSRQSLEESESEYDSKTVSANEEETIQTDTVSVLSQMAKVWIQSLWTKYRLETFIVIVLLGLFGSILIHEFLNNRSSSFHHRRTELLQVSNA